MAQQTAQSVTALPGKVHSFSPKTEFIPPAVLGPGLLIDLNGAVGGNTGKISVVKWFTVSIQFVAATEWVDGTLAVDYSVDGVTWAAYPLVASAITAPGMVRYLDVRTIPLIRVRRSVSATLSNIVTLTISGGKYDPFCCVE